MVEMYAQVQPSVTSWRASSGQKFCKIKDVALSISYQMVLLLNLQIQY